MTVMTDHRTRRRPKLHLTLPPDDRNSGELFRAAYAGIFDSNVSPGFHASIEKVDLGGALLTRGNANGNLTFRRTADHIRRHGLDNVQLITYLRGSWRGDYDGQSSSGSPGGMRLAFESLPMLHASTSNTYVSLSVARSALGREPRKLHGLAIKAELAGARLLGAHLRALWDTATELTRHEAAAAVEATVSLMRAILEDVDPNKVMNCDAIESTVFAMARNYIDQHLSEGALTPASISAYLHLSPRTLYRIFEPFGGVSAYIQSRRLDRAYNALSAPEAQAIASIAYKSGFVSAPHFSRAFRARFGVTPGELRLGAQSDGNPAPINTVLAWQSSA